MNIGKRKSKDFISLILIFILATIIRFLFSNYYKVMLTYGDELIYYSIAKSLFQHNGVTVHGNLFPIQNIAYSIWLSFFMVIPNAILRMKAMTFFNAILLSSSIFPVWLICNEISLEKKYRWLSILIILTWPDMAANASLMSENLFWPLFLWTIFFVIKSLNTYSLKYYSFAGIMSYLTFFCKESALCIPLAFLSYSIIYPFIKRRILGESSEKKSIYGMFIYLALFFALYITVKYFFFNNNNNFYSGLIDIKFITKPYNLGYLLYGFVYYLIAVTLAFGILPLIYPLVTYKQLDLLTQKIITFILIYILGTSLMIALTITVREDLGRITPRIHLRYIAPLIAVMIPLFFNSFQLIRNYKTIQIILKNIFIIFFLYGIVLLFIFKGPYGFCFMEHNALHYYDIIIAQLKNILVHNNNQYIAYILCPAIINLLIIIIMLGVNKQIIVKSKLTFFIYIIILANCVNNYSATNNYRRTLVDTSIITEMSAINDWFHSNNVLKKNILYIGSPDPLTTSWKVFDAYFDGTDIITATTTDLAVQIFSNDKIISPEDYIFNEVIWKRQYDGVSDIDYIIIEASELPSLIINNVAKIADISGNNYIVYQNLDTHILDITPNAPIPDFDIYFYGNKSNYKEFISQGISEMESTYSWTEGKQLSVNMPVNITDATSIHVCIIVKGTYGLQKYSIISNNDNILSSSIDGPGIIEFDIPLVNESISFNILLPDAVSPKEKGESEDPRELALQISKLNLYYK